MSGDRMPGPRWGSGPGPVPVVLDEQPGPAQDHARTGSQDHGQDHGGGARTGGALVLASQGIASGARATGYFWQFLAPRAKRLARRVFRKGALHDLFRHLWNSQPKSLAQHQAHIKAAAWIPAWIPEEYADDAWVTWARRAWAAWHLTFGRSLKAAGNTLSALGDSARATAAFLACLLIAVVFAAVFIF